ncbi:hypothetical protein BU23DRAFT_569510 [Bimuria novae-zelandiae CBS 107.79]|uniref:Uncharacterized protein n=1 Tax=Bimuria novae-zelandiae CBS 107.79 TaxID=1447943 RepID=A0A6A5VAH3_9PLEO|nr:hypothetical protein BU23DRAFT_569510 [Bimuria novae-zelandiae CBS 107.79]
MLSPFWSDPDPRSRSRVAVATSLTTAAPTSLAFTPTSIQRQTSASNSSSNHVFHFGANTSYASRWNRHASNLTCRGTVFSASEAATGWSHYPRDPDSNPSDSWTGPVVVPPPADAALDPIIPLQSSRLYSDGRPPTSWATLPNEIQLQILENIVKQQAPVSSATRTKYSKKILLSLQLVNTRMSEQVRHIYQKHHFVLVHGLDYDVVLHEDGVYRNVPANKILKHPHPRFCHEIKNLEMHIFPQSFIDRDLLADAYSLAPLFRYRQHLRDARKNSPFGAVAEAACARRIAWQESLMSLRRMKVVFDFARTQGESIRHLHLRSHLLTRGCYDDHRRGFVSLLGLCETAFPNLEAVDVVVQHIKCVGHTGTWSRELGLVEKDPKERTWTDLFEACHGCPERIGLALEAALLRSTWEEL